jgi:5-methylcytosine-specific restriction endonuclease McrA
MHDLPIWKPSQHLMILLGGDALRRQSFLAFRASSNAYIQKPKIRAYIMKKYNNECYLCESTDYLQIDHIVSVSQCFRENNLEKCNTPQNLQVLCRSCNASKSV